MLLAWALLNSDGSPLGSSAYTSFNLAVTSSDLCSARYSATAVEYNSLHEMPNSCASSSAESNTSSGIDIAVFMASSYQGYDSCMKVPSKRLLQSRKDIVGPQQPRNQV